MTPSTTSRQGRCRARFQCFVGQPWRAARLKNRRTSPQRPRFYPCHRTQPLGQTRISNELRKPGVFISPSGMLCPVTPRPGLLYTQAQGAVGKGSTGRPTLTDEQVSALVRIEHDDEACGEIETQHPSLPGFTEYALCGHVQRFCRV